MRNPTETFMRPVSRLAVLATGFFWSRACLGPQLATAAPFRVPTVDRVLIYSYSAVGVLSPVFALNPRSDVMVALGLATMPAALMYFVWVLRRLYRYPLEGLSEGTPPGCADDGIVSQRSKTTARGRRSLAC